MQIVPNSTNEHVPSSLACPRCGQTVTHEIDPTETHADVWAYLTEPGNDGIPPQWSIEDVWVCDHCQVAWYSVIS